jgi:hypothetical protein
MNEGGLFSVEDGASMETLRQITVHDTNFYAIMACYWALRAKGQSPQEALSESIAHLAKCYAKSILYPEKKGS